MPTIPLPAGLEPGNDGHAIGRDPRTMTVYPAMPDNDFEADTEAKEVSLHPN